VQIEIELAFDVVIRGAWKSSRHRCAEYGEFEQDGRVGGAQHNYTKSKLEHIRNTLAAIRQSIGCY
jgi:hypothetical protein